MLTRWLTFTALLVCSASPERAAFNVAPACGVKGHPEAELTLNCGDGKSAGVVQYWHTPFGDLQIPGSHSDLDPVIMHHDGSLVVPNTSSLHSGLYYCLLQHTEGTTLWPYKLHVSQNTQKNQEHKRKQEQHSSSGAFRFRRDAGSEAERQIGVSDGQFAGAVAASVLVTFVLGFSAGALSRTHVLRCLGAVTSRLRLPWKRRSQTNTPDRGTEVTMTTLPPMYDNQSFETEQVWDDNSANCASMNTTISSTASSPPAKPKRSFRNKRQEEQETTAYLEGCDYMKEEARRMEEAVGGSVDDRKGGGEGGTEEEQEERELYLSEDGRSQTETDEDECSEEGESREVKKDWRQEEDVEENRSKKGGEWRGEGEEKVKGRDEEREKEEKKDWRQEEDVEEDRSKKGGEWRGEGEEKVKGRDEEREKEEKEEWRQEKEVEAGELENRSEEGGEWRGQGKEEVGDNKEKGREERREEEGDDGEKGSEEDGETDSEDGETGSQKQEDTANSGVTEGEAASSPCCRGRRSRVIRLYQYDDDGQRYCHLPDHAPDERGPAPKLKQRSLSLTRLSAIMAAASAGPLDTREAREARREETGERPHFHMDI